MNPFDTSPLSPVEIASTTDISKKLGSGRIIHTDKPRFINDKFASYLANHHNIDIYDENYVVIFTPTGFVDSFGNHHGYITSYRVSEDEWNIKTALEPGEEYLSPHMLIPKCPFTKEKNNG